jgi:hypothetical protein
MTATPASVTARTTVSASCRAASRAVIAASASLARSGTVMVISQA